MTFRCSEKPCQKQQSCPTDPNLEELNPVAQVVIIRENMICYRVIEYNERQEEKWQCTCKDNVSTDEEHMEITFTWNTIIKVKGESEVTQSCPTLCDLMDCSLPGSSVHGIFQARILEWVSIAFSRGSSRPSNQTWVSGTANRHFTIWATMGLQP